MTQTDNGRSSLVLYGSETGNAQEIAEEIGRLCERLHFAVKLSELNAVGIRDLLQHSIVIFAISTTGQGDLPQNSQNFWKKLRNARLPPSCLSGLSFTSFGLGDSSYPQYNWAHRKLYNRLVQLGAQPLCDKGEADEQYPDGVDGLFIPWSSKLRTSLLTHFPLPSGTSVIPYSEFLTPKWRARVIDRKPVRGHSLNDTSGTDLAPVEDSVTATLRINQRLTPISHWQDVRLFDFALPPTATYDAGDILTVFPRNEPDDVDQLLGLMGWIDLADLPLAFEKTGSAIPFYPDKPFAELLSGYPLTLRKLLTNHLDINAIPRRSFFAAVAHFTEDETQKERLIEFTKPELVDELYDYTTRPRRSIIEVLQEFTTVKIPIEWVASVFPTLRGRQFSIASGGKLKQWPDGSTRVQLLVAIVRYKTVIKKIRQGVCTRYLAGLQPGTALNVRLVKSGMSAKLQRPCIMIGSGTGVAPLRAMVYDRLQIGNVNDATRPMSDHALFYGCRSQHADYFFGDEWSQLQSHTGLQVYAAFSRDQSQKVYVQDLIRRESAKVYALLKVGAVYVCGSSGKMPQAVRAALVEVIAREGSCDHVSAETQLTRMEKEGRYQQETW